MRVDLRPKTRPLPLWIIIAAVLIVIIAIVCANIFSGLLDDNGESDNDVSCAPSFRLLAAVSRPGDFVFCAYLSQCSIINTVI